MPAGFIPNEVGHDDLQAIVSTLPGIGLLGGPVVPEAAGLRTRVVDEAGGVPRHRVEGLIWNARPANAPDAAGPDAAGAVQPPQPLGGNPLAPKDRDSIGDDAMERGVKLFQELVRRVNDGHADGIGYADFITVINDVDNYTAVMGRDYGQCDTRWVLEVADFVTSTAGGAEQATRSGVSIRVGMDSFIWRKKSPHDLANAAFCEHQRKYGYTREEWELVFPRSMRRPLALEDAKQICAL